MKPNASLKVLNLKLLWMASRPCTSLQPRSVRRAEMRASPARRSAMLERRAQRIGLFDRIRPAAARRPRREQHEPVDGEKPAGIEIVVGDEAMNAVEPGV